jgi:hypothetical protein
MDSQKVSKAHSNTTKAILLNVDTHAGGCSDETGNRIVPRVYISNSHFPAIVPDLACEEAIAIAFPVLRRMKNE